MEKRRRMKINIWYLCGDSALISPLYISVNYNNKNIIMPYHSCPGRLMSSSSGISAACSVAHILLHWLCVMWRKTKTSLNRSLSLSPKWHGMMVSQSCLSGGKINKARRTALRFVLRFGVLEGFGFGFARWRQTCGDGIIDGRRCAASAPHQ